MSRDLYEELTGRIIALEDEVRVLLDHFREIKDQIYGTRLPQYEYDLEEYLKGIIKEVEDEEGKL